MEKKDTDKKENVMEDVVETIKYDDYDQMKKRIKSVIDVAIDKSYNVQLSKVGDKEHLLIITSDNFINKQMFILNPPAPMHIPQKDELCLVSMNGHSWNKRYATGKMSNGGPTFWCDGTTSMSAKDEFHHAVWNYHMPTCQQCGLEKGICKCLDLKRI